jgi:prefoldin subunit 5
MSLTLDELRAELAPIKARVDGLPFITRQLELVRQELRQLKAAFNDFALTNVTAGEIAALHQDVNAIQTKHLELETKLATLERLITEMQ